MRQLLQPVAQKDVRAGTLARPDPNGAHDMRLVGARRHGRRQGVNQGSVCVPPVAGSFVQPSAVHSIWSAKWQSAQPLSLP